MVVYCLAMAGPIPPKSYADLAEFPTRIELTPIGVVRSPHKERHGTPRQAVMAADPQVRPDERARIELFADVVDPEVTDDLEGFDRIWVLAWMHLNHGFPTKVTPPGETRARGLFSTRAPHRPNPIALSSVELVSARGLVLELARIDLLDGTPVLDIKPYVAYADSFPDARAGWLSARDRVPDR